MRNDALAAVTEPCGLTTAGLRLLIFSIVASPRTPFSAVFPSPAMISSSYSPSACAFAPAWCARSAYSDPRCATSAVGWRVLSSSSTAPAARATPGRAVLTPST